VKRTIALLAALACVVALRAPAAAEWRPRDLRPTTTPLAEVFAVYAKGTGRLDSRFARRRERWSYVNGSRRLPVTVAVDGDDFRATVTLNGAQYAGGRSAGIRWRADANGIAHATLSDDQGDAIDRLPQAAFPFAYTDCELAGESERFGRRSWVLLDRAAHDKPHWFYLDKSTGLIANEITREGARTIVTTFYNFEPLGGLMRPRRWQITDGDPANDLDVQVEGTYSVPVPIGSEVAMPQTKRIFTAPAVADGIVSLPARFRGSTIFVAVDVDGHPTEFVLDTGTASITYDSRLAQNFGYKPTLEHATLPTMVVGKLALTDVSTLAIPFSYGERVHGILGYDFFAGHIVHIDYANRRVDVMTPQAAAGVFGDARNTVIPAAFDEGVPLIRASFGTASGDRFALDSGSPHLIVLAPFERRYKTTIDNLWRRPASGSADRFGLERYLEGSIAVAARNASSFSFGGAQLADVPVEIEEPNAASDAIDIALDGIIGTDQMRMFDWWFDYDGGRIALRRNGLR
jgi:hypothetical protein